MENCYSHSINDEPSEILNRRNTEIRYFTANETDIMHPANSFSVQKIKRVCTRRRICTKKNFCGLLVSLGCLEQNSELFPIPVRTAS